MSSKQYPVVRATAVRGGVAKTSGASPAVEAGATVVIRANRTAVVDSAEVAVTVSWSSTTDFSAPLATETFMIAANRKSAQLAAYAEGAYFQVALSTAEAAVVEVWAEEIPGDQGATALVPKNSVVYNVSDHGVTLGPSGNRAANGSAFRALIAAVIASGGGVIHVPSGQVAQVDYLSVSGSGNVNLTLEGGAGASIYFSPIDTADAFTIASGATSTSDPFIKRVTIRNLTLKGASDPLSGTKAPRRGLVVSAAQNLILEDVWISQFRDGALVLTDVWDSVFDKVQVLWSGHGSAVDNYAYAIQLTGDLDNSNALHFTSCHTEFTPLTMSIDGLSRHNYFTNCKFEHGSETATNSSGLSPIYLGDCIEIGFESCFFTENKTPTQPLIQSDQNTNPYLLTYALRKHVAFIGCDFFATSAVKSRWYAGSGATFQGCVFQRCNGASAGGFVMDLAFENTINDCRFGMADAGSAWLRITASRNKVVGNQVYTAGAGDDGSIYTIGGSATYNLIRDNLISGTAASSIATSMTHLGTNVVTNAFNASRSLAGGGAVDVFGHHYITLTDSGATTYTNFMHAGNGTTIYVKATNGGVVTIQHNANISLAGGANKVLAAGEVLVLVNLAGVWHQAN